MKVLDSPRLVFLSHANWSGIGAICGFVALPLALAGLVFTYFWGIPPEKKLEVRLDYTIKLAATKDAKGDPTHAYLLSYMFTNTGNTPIVPGDFADDPSVMTTLPCALTSVMTVQMMRPQQEKSAFEWTSPKNIDWTCRPFLLNPGQEMPVMIQLIPPSGEEGSADFDPTIYVHWGFDIAGVNEVKYTRVIRFRPVPTVISMMTFGRYTIAFQGAAVWAFLALGLAFFTGVTCTWLRRCDKCPNAYWMTANILLLLIFSFSLSEIIVCLFTLKGPVAWDACAPIIIIYATYIFWLFRRRNVTTETTETLAATTTKSAPFATAHEEQTRPLPVSNTPCA